MAKAKEIQRRIKSINNTKKITKAMEMVAAAKMRKAVEAVLRTRTYANLSWTTVVNLSRSLNERGERMHPLFKERKKIKRVGLVLITSNRGLCGGFNSYILAKTDESIKKHHYRHGKEKIEVEIVVLGKKGLGIFQRYGHKIVAEFPKSDVASQAREVWPVAKMMVDGFLSKHYDKVMVAYTDYVSASKYVPRVKQLLPVDIDDEDDFLGVVGGDTRVGVDKEFVAKKESKYLTDEERNKYAFVFEPSAREVLDEMVPRLVEIQIFQALLESNASEHSARMAAMHQATEAAGDLSKELTLSYNKARQASITAEIAEISAGAEALK